MLKTSVVYLLIFSFLLAGCYTTNNYSDTPQNIISGKSEIKLGNGFVLDSLILKSFNSIRLQNYYTQFIDCNKDTCGRFIFRSLTPVIDTVKMLTEKSRTILYKKNTTDTIAVSGISKMFYSKENFDWGNFASLSVVGLGLFIILGILFLKYVLFPHGVG